MAPCYHFAVMENPPANEFKDVTSDLSTTALYVNEIPEMR